MKKRKIFIFIFICFFKIQVSVSQVGTDVKLVELADEMYNFGDKKDALAVYLQALDINPKNIDANYKAGKCYLETVDKNKSTEYLEIVYKAKPNYSPDILYKLGLGYQFGNNFNAAIKHYELYKNSITEINARKILIEEKYDLVPSSKVKEIKRADRKIYECENARELQKFPTKYQIRNIGNVINSDHPDYAPALTPDEKTMIFTSRRNGGMSKNKDFDNEFFEDVYISNKINDSTWSTPRNMGTPINSATHDASVGISADGSQLFVYRSSNRGDIYVCKKINDTTWSEPKSMGGEINTKHYEPSLCMSYDGKTVYFCSDKPGGFGGLDIYKSVMTPKGDWSKAVNLGPTVNTFEDEDGPSLDIDEVTLYFSSRGHKGMGGYDIFKSVYDSTKSSWTVPENLGYPVNSTDDDVYFSVVGEGDYGYYASAKADGFGDKDVYKIKLRDKVNKQQFASNIGAESSLLLNDSLTKLVKLPINNLDETIAKNTKPVIDTKPKDIKPILETKPTVAQTLKPVLKNNEITFKGIITDAANKLGLVAKIVITDYNGNVVKEIRSGSDGSYSITVPYAGIDYLTLTVTKENYIFTTQTFVEGSLINQKLIQRNFTMTKIQVGQKIVLRNIYFDFNKSSLKAESINSLNKLVKLLNDNPTMKVEIGGHTDNVGGDDANMKLSEKRSEAVLDFCTSKGISFNRIVAKGYGETQPLASNDDEEDGRELNRRTEFKILKK